MHRYNNQNPPMLAAMLAVENILGEHHDLWNVERSYHEEFTDKKWVAKTISANDSQQSPGSEAVYLSS